MSYKVILHVYDLSHGMASSFSPFFLGMKIQGIWHTGIFVFDREYYFGGGICAGIPKQTPYGYPNQVEVDMGETEWTKELFEQKLQNDLQAKYTMEKYDLFERNCNHFTEECCQFLVGKSLPEFIKELPNQILKTQFGNMIKPFIQELTKNVVNDRQNSQISQLQINNNQSIQNNSSSSIIQKVSPFEIKDSQPYQQQQQEKKQVSQKDSELVEKQEQLEPQIKESISHSLKKIPEKKIISKVLEVKDIFEFIQILQSQAKMLVMFYQDWCPQSRQIRPTFDRLSSTSDLSMYAVRNPEILEQFEINQYPTFMIYENGVQKDIWFGKNIQVFQEKISQLK